MRVISLTIGIAVFAGLAACGNNAKLMNLTAGQESPDEFAILPTRPISMPPDLALLPTPTPGGSNITDPTPEADAVAALGGNPGALVDQGVAASDQGLVAYASRGGNDPAIRTTLAQSDQQWRARNQPRVLERVAGSSTYYRAYRRQSLDPLPELARWQRAGARTVTADPAPVEE